MAHSILCLNAGSSSLKYGVFLVDAAGCRKICGGNIGQIGAGPVRDQYEAVAAALAGLPPGLGEDLHAAGHRVVHGGARFAAPVRIDGPVLDYLRGTVPLAPEHQPGALAGMEAVQRLRPDLPQVACFDTAFHHALPERARRFPLAGELVEDGRLRRYGFHGLSYESVCAEIGSGMPPRTIIAHLGNGSSLVALKQGRPVETTMGFTPNSGLVMGSRCGDLEPGAIFFLLREKGYPADRLDNLLNQESGMKGVSGMTSDMRTLLEEAERQHSGALEALELYCYSAVRHIGALVAVLEGLDLLVFTGGIGEHAEAVRRRIAQPLRAYLQFEVRVVPTREEELIARRTAECCFG